MTPETLELPIESSNPASTKLEEFTDYTNPDGSIGGQVSLGNKHLGILPPRIGKDVVIAEGSRILGDTVIEDGAVILEGAHIYSKVIIGRMSIVGAKAQVRDGAKIGCEAKVGKESWICRKAEIPSHAVVSPGGMVLGSQ